MLDPEERCAFEIKLHSKKYPLRRKKYRLEAPIGEVLSALADPVNFHQLDGKPLVESKTVFSSGLLTAICERDRLNCLLPVAATHYHRRHFKRDFQRITVDSSLSYWDMISVYGDWIGCRVDNQSQQTTVEVKTFFKKAKSSPLITPKQLLESNPGLSDACTKFEHIKDLQKQGVHAELVTPDIDIAEDEKDWRWYEQEVKINTASDPRSALEEMRLEPETECVMGKTKKMVSHQEFIQIEDKGGICIMQTEGRKDGPVIKFKLPIDYDEKRDILIRSEQGFPYSEENLQETIGAMGGDPGKEYPRTSSFDRLRSRRILATKTGHVFLIIADHCVAEDNRPPLNQLEIEHVGYLSVKNERMSPDDYNKTLTADFKRVTDIFLQDLESKGLKPQISQQTKYMWISE